MSGMRKLLMRSAANSSMKRPSLPKHFRQTLAQAAEGGMDGYVSVEHPFRAARPDLARLI
jgi:hypothetical protein